MLKSHKIYIFLGNLHWEEINAMPKRSVIDVKANWFNWIKSELNYDKSTLIAT